MTTPPSQLVTTRFIDMLKEIGAWDVYDHRIPTTARAPKMPYLVVYSISGGGFSGPPLKGPEEDATFALQVTSVAERRDQVQLVADRVAEVVTGRNADGTFVYAIAPITGWAFVDRMRYDVPGGVDRQGVPPHDVFSAPQLFHISITPSSS